MHYAIYNESERKRNAILLHLHTRVTLLGVAVQVTLDGVRPSQAEGNRAAGVHQSVMLGQGELAKAIPHLEVVYTAQVLRRDLHGQVIVKARHNLKQEQHHMDIRINTETQ